MPPAPRPLGRGTAATDQKPADKVRNHWRGAFG